jgi:hypothetical protein
MSSHFLQEVFSMRRLLLTFAASALMGSVALAAPVQGPAQAPVQKGAAPVQAPTQKVSPAQKPTQAPVQKNCGSCQAPTQKGAKMASAPRGLRYR